MFLNYFNASYSYHDPPAFSTLIENLKTCWSSRIGASSIIFLAIINCLILLPLCIFILNQGLKKWKQRRSGTAWSHSDVYTYHMTFIELMNITGSILCCFGVHTNVPGMELVGIYFLATVFSGQISFHILTCVERYLAVVHPITYVSLKKANGIRIRNVLICCVWLVCFSGMGILTISCHLIVTFVYFAMIPIVLVIVLYFSVSVLCALMRPGPGDECRNRKRVDQSKLRAFITITVILLVLLMRFLATICIEAVYSLQLGGSDDATNEKCGLWLSEFWFNLPSSLVLPLLFLQRAGKLSCCKNRNTSGRKNATS